MSQCNLCRGHGYNNVLKRAKYAGGPRHYEQQKCRHCKGSGEYPPPTKATKSKETPNAKSQDPGGSGRS